ncbi:uncharacterized protein LOC134278600 [Saccostrea cucullata]|uniref:uncharacterized protein LOC134278600 n=1 Tax=Saccostrea cuccullata TaxID=36930 RepID=UPI002ED490D7
MGKANVNYRQTEKNRQTDKNKIQGHLYFLVLVIVVSLGICQRFPAEKPGRCPPIYCRSRFDCPYIGGECTRDRDCLYHSKCCPVDCGCETSCVRPLYGVGPQPGGCFYNGRYYAIGQSFPAGDGYNTCGCNESGQVFCTLIACSNVCSLPRDFGGCYAIVPRWWFNSLTNQCEFFIYGGCAGNENNFQSFQECYQRCGRGRRIVQGLKSLEITYFNSKVNYVFSIRILDLTLNKTHCPTKTKHSTNEN